jgi:hypothetical protein
MSQIEKILWVAHHGSLDEFAAKGAALGATDAAVKSWVKTGGDESKIEPMIGSRRLSGTPLQTSDR